NFRVLRERNLAMACIILFCAFAVVYGASIALPGMLQTLFGYDALQAGLVMSPSGASSMAAMILVGILLGRQFDARWMIAAGLVAMAVGSYWMARMNIQISPAQVTGPRMVLTLGLGLLFAPATVAAFKYIPVHLRGAAVGLLSLLRTEGGSVGTSMAENVVDRRLQFHTERMGEFLDPLNPHVNTFLEQSHGYLLQMTGDPAGSQLGALQALSELRLQQAASMAYLDVFWLCAVVSIALVVLVLMMKRSAAEKGEHVAAH
ncbi:MAG: MFS transporter, partial [Planctomycetes bacterium]|nr:MFS transporter [Planctomycetota bacterium]